MPFSRRHFLKATTAASAVACLPNMAWAKTPSVYVPSLGHRMDVDLHALAVRAVDAAKSAGAMYADARITQTREEQFIEGRPTAEVELHAIGVRVLVNGYWGFQSSAVWTPDEAVRLARGAVEQARANGAGQTRDIDFGPPLPVVKGDWVMPVKYDPFRIPLGEKADFIADVVDYAQSYMIGLEINSSMLFQRQHKIFASSEGSLWSQTTYVTQGSFGISYRDQLSLELPQGAAGADFLSPAGKGWEHISESGLIDAIPSIIDQAEQSRRRVIAEPNRFDLVCSAGTLATIADATIGAASELDRALGYEANASGTSYLNDPLEMLGTYKAGSTLLNISANRSLPGGAATVKWDDESIEPETFTLVKDGLLTDYQTTREQAAWLRPYYQKIDRPIRSHGCAGAQSAMSITTQHSPNIELLPGNTNTTFEDLVADTERGLAVLGIGGIIMDQQQLNGVAYPLMRQITKGKLGPYVVGGGILFRSPEFWKGLTAIGGPKTTQWMGVRRGKGQPWQSTVHSIGGVPGKVTNVSIIDVMRKA